MRTSTGRSLENQVHYICDKNYYDFSAELQDTCIAPFPFVDWTELLKLAIQCQNRTVHKKDR